MQPPSPSKTRRLSLLNLRALFSFTSLIMPCYAYHFIWLMLMGQILVRDGTLSCKAVFSLVNGGLLQKPSFFAEGLPPVWNLKIKILKVKSFTFFVVAIFSRLLSNSSGLKKHLSMICLLIFVVNLLSYIVYVSMDIRVSMYIHT